MLTSLKLTNFRNYEYAQQEFHPNLNIIVGKNGIGKTNLLEAISLLAPGKGLRAANLPEIAKTGQTSWSIFAQNNGYKIGTGWEVGAKKRIIKIDGEVQKSANILANYTSAIWLTPQMDGVFLASGSERRRFFDRIIYNFDPEHASRVAIYENAMRERLRLLKNNTNDRVWLTALEKRMAEYGTAIAAARVEVVEYLQNAINSRESLFPKPEINIMGKYEELIKSRSALEVEQFFMADLSAARQADANQGRTSTGVHKTDFKVINTAKNIAAEYASTGEQKALLLSIILALANLLKSQKNRKVILLLDEVVAHLDEARRAELFAEIDATGAQAFLTGTDNALFFGLNAKIIDI